MTLLTRIDRTRLPDLHATENEKDPVAQVRFFTMWSAWVWYAIEFDGEDVFFGLVQGFEEEFGLFRLSDLQSGRGPNQVERDLHFKPMRLSKVHNR